MEMRRPEPDLAVVLRMSMMPPAAVISIDHSRPAILQARLHRHQHDSPLCILD
jgi:hypothetical protein